MSGLAVALDSNLLLLFVVGNTSRDLIARHKRLREFDAGDYDLLLEPTARCLIWSRRASR